VFTGCSSKTANESAPAEPSKADYAVEEQGTAGTAPASTSAQTSNRKLIVKLSMDMRVDNIEKSILDAETMAENAGGYTRESYQNELSGQLTIMVPAGEVDTFIKSLRSLGKIINSNRKTEDVTDSYFDTQIRIKNLEIEIETMRNLLQKPGWKVSEILEIEREIRRLTDELESLKGYITNLDRQITYSEVRISFEKSQISIDSASQDGLGYKLQLALKSGIDLLINIVISLLSLIAFILPISPFIAIAYFLLRKPLRHFKRNDKQEPKL
jgi:chromosome segregation ATPase